MNVATHSCIYCLYPRGTFYDNVSLLRIHWPTFVTPAELTTYESTGLHIADRRPDHLSLSFPDGKRRVGDRYTWTLRLDLGVGDSNYSLMTNTWLNYYYPLGRHDVHGMVIRSHRLEDPYTVFDDTLRKIIHRFFRRLDTMNDDGIYFVDARLHELVVLNTTAS